ncbi:outer membrane lipoprotein-sorting protein [Dysgonomonas sp. PH5-45]|uniref:LolA family protein n=1 Tax=unclassified Dysgonomonas TaxID=2630389 RepID=UPI002476A164|nr:MULTISPECIES: LolA-like putative outer membrane lipoprotein chaperone [unclassified Dysgonomonas]MDH6353750.1 outer membrane lipoprotein-sorting protein [Dysgonomonas sp. PH5-45]MDH6386653.1 outer membrane lipoprotein-sorting protein [Dysgonomonas sp. PH5-37]
MKLKFLSLFIVFLSVCANGQNAKAILDKASSEFSKAGGVSVSFTLNNEFVREKKTYSQDGTAFIKGNKFRIEVPDGITWFDGKTQWVHQKGSGEVNVSNPTREELASISPTVLLNLYKTGFNLTYKGEAKDRGKAVLQVEMVPQKSGSDVSKFLLKINKQTYQITSIIIYNTDGNKTHLLVNKYKTGGNYSDATFRFDRKANPNIEVIDLR